MTEVKKLAPRVLYHGTTHRNANKILKEGFSPRGKEGFPTVRAYTPYPEDVKDKVFTSPDKKYVKGFAQYRAYQMHEGAPARIKMTHVGPRTNWREVDNPDIRQKEYIIDPKDIINMKRDGVRQEWVNRGALGAGAAGVGGYQYKKHRERKKVQKGIGAAILKPLSSPAKGATPKMAQALKPKMPKALTPPKLSTGVTMPKPNIQKSEVSKAGRYANTANPASLASDRQGRHVGGNPFDFREANARTAAFQGNFSSAAKPGRHAAANPAFNAPDRKGRHVGGNPFDFREANARSAAFNPQKAKPKGSFLKPLVSLGRKVLRKSDEVEKGIGTAAKLMQFKPIVPKISTEGAASMAGRARAKMNANPARATLKPPTTGPRHRAEGSGIKMPNLTTAAAGAGGLAVGAGGAALYHRKHQS